MRDIQSWSFPVNGIPVTASFYTSEIQKIFLPLLRHWTDMQKEKGKRLIILLAAPPGAGKSTLASFLQAYSLTDDSLTFVQALGMDGFHHTNAWLKAHFDANGEPLINVKGREDTFDQEKLLAALQKVQSENIGWPVYSRIAHAPIEDAIEVNGSILLIEGNYFLLDEPIWRSMQKTADETMFLSAEETLLHHRLVARKMASGMSREKAEEFYVHSDGVNVSTVLHHSLPADFSLKLAEGKEAVHYIPLVRKTV